MTTATRATQSEKRDDAALLDLVASRNPVALSELVDRHGRALVAYAMSMLGHLQDAEDVVQETLVVAWNRAASARVVSGSALPWLLTICRNKSLHRLRQRGRTAAVDFSGSEPVSVHSVEESAEMAECMRVLRRAVNELSDADRAIYDLCIVNGLSYAHAARQLGLSDGSVRNRIFRLRRRLRLELATLKG